MILWKTGIFLGILGALYSAFMIAKAIYDHIEHINGAAGVRQDLTISMALYLPAAIFLTIGGLIRIKRKRDGL
jgi:hypothetical protein